MSKHKDKDKERVRERSKSRSRDRERTRDKKRRSRDRDRSPKERNRDKDGREKRRRRSHSRERRSKDRDRSKRHNRDDDRQYDDERQYEKEKERDRKRDREQEELREKEMERQRLREIAMELKAAQFVLDLPAPAPVPLMSLTPMYQPEPPPPPKPEVSQAFLEAVAASQRIAASKNFAEIFNCTNSNDSASNGPTPIEDSNNATSNNNGTEREARQRKKRSRWGGSENDKTFIPGMPTILPASLDSHQQEAYLVQLQIEEISRKLRTGDLGIASAEERSPSPEPIYSSDGKRLNTREFRTRKRLEEQRHQLILRMQCMNPEFKPPSDYKAPVIRVSDKVLIPQEEHPDINFVGLLIGPRGNTLKAMEKDTGAKIIIRGKGSVKEGKVGRKDGQPLPGEDEPLHAFITAANLDCVKKAVEKINEVIKQGIEVPEGHNDLRRMQLRELAQLNGTLRETDGPRCQNCGSSEHKSWLCPDKPNVTNNIMCSSCGGAGHIAKDCKGKRPGQGGPPNADDQAKIDEEYLSLMAELGEGPPPSRGKDNDAPPQTQSNRNNFSIFDRPSAPRAITGSHHSHHHHQQQQSNQMQHQQHQQQHQQHHQQQHQQQHQHQHQQQQQQQQPAPPPPQPPQPYMNIPPLMQPPPPMIPSQWNQPLPPGSDLPLPPGTGPLPNIVPPPPPPPGTSASMAPWNVASSANASAQYPWGNGHSFAPPPPPPPNVAGLLIPPPPPPAPPS